jgi:hypothetical protein
MFTLALFSWRRKSASLTGLCGQMTRSATSTGTLSRTAHTLFSPDLRHISLLVWPGFHPLRPIPMLPADFSHVAYSSPWWSKHYSPLKRLLTRDCTELLRETCRLHTRHRENLKPHSCFVQASHVMQGPKGKNCECRCVRTSCWGERSYLRRNNIGWLKQFKNEEL